MSDNFVASAKIMANGQITLPKAVRKVLGVASGDYVTFIAEEKNVRIMNAAVYAMQNLQSEMAEEAKLTGLASEEEVMALVKELRDEPE